MFSRQFVWFFTAVFWLPISTLKAQEPISAEYKKFYAEAVAAMESENYELALQKLDQAESDTPGKIPTLEMRGDVYMKQREFSKAVETYRTLSKLYPEYEGAMYNYGEALFLSKEYPQAKQAFTQYLETKGNERNALVRYKVFLCDLMAGNTVGVEEQLRALQPTISHPLEYFCRAAYLYQQEKDLEAESLINSAFAIYQPAINILFAQSLAELGFLKIENIPKIERIDGNALKSLSHEFQPVDEQGTRSLGQELENQLPSLGE